MNQRRHFLTVLSASALALGCGSRIRNGDAGGGQGQGGGVGGSGGAGGQGTGGQGGAGGSGCSTMPAGTKAGMLPAFTAMGLHRIGVKRFLVGRDVGGLYAMSSICTHQACNLNTQGTLLKGGTE